MMDGCTVSCTLKNGNTPMSGETITLSYTDLLGPVAINVITTSSGVVTYHYESYDFGLGVLPVTLTATYQGVTATCTIVEG